jgi:hypothetical protein
VAVALTVALALALVVVPREATAGVSGPGATPAGAAAGARAPVARVAASLLWVDARGRSQVLARPRLVVAPGSAAQIRVVDPLARRAGKGAGEDLEWLLDFTPIGETSRGWITELRITSVRHGIERRRLVLLSDEPQRIELGPCQGRELAIELSAADPDEAGGAHLRPTTRSW